MYKKSVTESVAREIKDGSKDGMKLKKELKIRTNTSSKQVKLNVPFKLYAIQNPIILLYNIFYLSFI
jgi:hypothetical protein